jgi:hypothetical protein
MSKTPIIPENNIFVNFGKILERNAIAYDFHGDSFTVGSEGIELNSEEDIEQFLSIFRLIADSMGE